MEPQTTEPTPTVDAFDAAVTATSNYVEPPVSADVVVDDEADVNDAPAKVARDAAGKFTKPDDDKPIETKPAEKKPRNDPDARIAQAIGRQREAERRADEAQRRADDAERRAQQARPVESKPVEAPKADKFPTYAQYLDTHADASLEDYMDARDDWKDQRRETKFREQREVEQLEQSFTTRATKFSDQYAAAKEADPDLPSRIDTNLLTVKPYSTLTAADKDLIRQIPNKQDREMVAFRCFLADQWLESEHAVALLEHISDPSVFQRLATLPPNQVIRELAKVEAGFGAAPRKDASGSVAEIKPASKARPPFKPLGTTSHVAADDEGSDEEPVEKHFNRYNAIDRKAGRL